MNGIEGKERENKLSVKYNFIILNIYFSRGKIIINYLQYSWTTFLIVDWIVSRPTFFSPKQETTVNPL